MDEFRQQAIEELINLQRQLKTETDPKKKEKIMRQMRVVQTLGINSMYGAYDIPKSALFSNKALDRR